MVGWVTMGKNFLAMPALLKLLTAVVIVPPLFCVASLSSTGSISVFGRQMTASAWWSSGAAVVTLIVSGLMVAAGLLLLGRSRYGRPTYVLGWIAVSMSAPLIAFLVGRDPPNGVPSLIFDLVLTVFIGLYLYKSDGVRSYFTSRDNLPNAR